MRVPFRWAAPHCVERDNRRIEGEEDIELPHGWVRWELEPIDSVGRHTADELMVSRGKLTSALVTKSVLKRKAGSKLRKRLLTAALRGGFGLTNRREYESLFRGTYAEHCELNFQSFFPDMLDGRWRGHEELLEYMSSFDDAYASMFFQPLEVVDPGGNMAGGAIKVNAVGRTTGIEIGQVFGIIYEFEDGLVFRQQILRDWPAAINEMKIRAGASAS